MLTAQWNKFKEADKVFTLAFREAVVNITMFVGGFILFGVAIVICVAVVTWAFRIVF